MAVLLFHLFIFFTQFVKLIYSSPHQIVPEVILKATNYQKWAHHHWVWLKNSDGNQENVMNLVNDYAKYSIPVGAVNIDSTWATQFNNFEVDTTRFPDFPGLISDLHKRGLKVILWATSMVNVENPDYEYAKSKGYLLRDSRGYVRPLKWWHGSGALLDYSNPEAVTWWHSLMDRVLDVGVDGFKCDGTDPYVLEYSLTGGALGYNNVTVSYRDYADAYYRDFFYYTRQKRSASGKYGDDGLIMSRPVDCNIDSVTKVCTPFSPKDVMYSGWVGDDDATFQGLNGCLRKVIYSAWMGYANMGCDIGGYRGNDNSKDANTFLRWAQLGAFLPLMENGGGGEHRPWMYDEKRVVQIYRKYVNEHHRLASYLHTTGANAVDTRTAAIHPVDDRTIAPPVDSDRVHIFFPQPRSYSYRLGDDLLVHPVVWNEMDSKTNVTDVSTVHMTFPNHPADQAKGETTVWLDYFQPNEMRRAHKGGDKAIREVPLESYAVYVRSNSLLPLEDLRPTVGSAGDIDIETERVVTFTWFRPDATKANSKENAVVYELRESQTTGNGMRAKGYFDSSSSQFVVEVSAHPGPVAFSLVGVTAPTADSDIHIDAFKISRCDSRYEKLEKTLHISCANNIGGMRAKISNIQLDQ